MPDRYVAVIGPGTASPELYRLAHEVGAELARRQAILLCGGLGGVMEAAARGAREGSPPGRTIGLLPGTDRGEGSPFLDYALPTGLAEARDGALVTSADAVIAVGCNPGTLIEIGYALKRQRPLAVLAGWSVLDESGQPVTGYRAARTAAEAVALVLGDLGSARDRHR
ncbi:TIGR00725 family protein [Jatrophihabitans sp.]|uniref:TIGR00725 family protein n=1 Tax=Jatrophihabitans sp. TaxID=1932789 RepID=UPI002EF89D42